MDITSLRKSIVFIFIVVYLLAYASGFYLPGVPQNIYKKGDLIPIQVNKLSSTKTQLPYRYYGLHGLCHPKEEFQEHKNENLGEILRGDSIESSLYKVQIK